MSLKVGDIGFLNSWPVTYALSNGLIESEASLVRGVPAKLNADLLEGRLDVSAISSFAYLKHTEELVLLPRLAIGSESGVNSVLLVSRTPISELQNKRIALTSQGATTPVMLRILLEKAFGVHAHYETLPFEFPQVLEQFDAALLIGDDALHAAYQGISEFHTWDLGELWKRWTGTSMVYAVWAARRDVVERDPEGCQVLREALIRSRNWGLQHLDEVALAASEENDFPVSFVKEYFEGIQYELDSSAQEGLRRFAQEAEGLRLVPQAQVEVLQ